MRIDIDYLSKILDVFLEADTSHIDLLTIRDAGISFESSESSGRFDQKFLFHIQIALENALISDKDLRVSGLKTVGISIGMNGRGTISAVPIRLTQRGHNFASAIHNKEILEKLKSGLKDAPFKVIFEYSQKLMQHYSKKKLDKLIE